MSPVGNLACADCCRPTGGLNVGKKGPKMTEIIQHARSVGAPIEIIDNKQIQQRYGMHAALLPVSDDLRRSHVL